MIPQVALGGAGSGKDRRRETRGRAESGGSIARNSPGLAFPPSRVCASPSRPRASALPACHPARVSSLSNPYLPIKSNQPKVPRHLPSNDVTPLPSPPPADPALDPSLLALSTSTFPSPLDPICRSRRTFDRFAVSFGKKTKSVEVKAYQQRLVHHQQD